MGYLLFYDCLNTPYCNVSDCLTPIKVHFHDFDDRISFVWQSLVHSANAWESSDLGNDGRKQKFLRLMGADKVM